MSVKVKIQNLEQFKSNLKGYVNQFADKKQQQQVLRPGAVVLRNAAKKLVPKSDKDHYYYRKGKKTKILSGNLQNSMYVYREATGEVSVGPRVLRKTLGPICTSPVLTLNTYIEFRKLPESIFTFCPAR